MNDLLDSLAEDVLVCLKTGAPTKWQRMYPDGQAAVLSALAAWKQTQALDRIATSLEKYPTR